MTYYVLNTNSVDSNTDIKEQVKLLWQRVFDMDTAEFVDYYFSYIYNDDCCYWMGNNEGMVVSALQSLPYLFSYHGEQVGMRYISGASTYVEYRDTGLMGELMRKSIIGAYADEDELMTLIPANEGLYGYYARFGFAPIFKKLRVTHNYSCGDNLLGFTVKSIGEVGAARVYDYLHKRQCVKLASICHSKEDFKHICYDYDGRVFVLLGADSEVCGIAFIGTESCVNLIYTDCESDSKVLLNLLCSKLGLTQIDYMQADSRGAKWGMGRVINAEHLLATYAKANPELNKTFAIKDDVIAENNRRFTINKGLVNEVSELVEDIPIITIEELTDKLFSDNNADLSLMLE